MRHCILKKKLIGKGKPDLLEHDEYEGQGFMPEVGKNFVMYVESPGEPRTLRTSTLKLVDKCRCLGEAYLITTKNGSVYRVSFEE